MSCNCGTHARMGYFGEGAVDGGMVATPYGFGPSYDVPAPTADQWNAMNAGAPAPLADQPYGPSNEPAQDFILRYKWYLLGGAGALFLLAGGSILGLSLRRRKKRR